MIVKLCSVRSFRFTCRFLVNEALSTYNLSFVNFSTECSSCPQDIKECVKKNTDQPFDRRHPSIR